MTHHLDLSTLTLARGGHSTPNTPGNPDGEVCLLEAVAWWAEEAHSDHPACVSPYLGAFGRRLNDRLSDDARQRLLPFVTKLPGTADDGKDPVRELIAADWLYRTCLPEWLDIAGLGEQAATLRGLPRVDSTQRLREVRRLTRPVRDELWTRRSKILAELREKVRAAVQEQLASKPVAVAAADAAAAAVAAAVAAAAAAADAAAAAVAAAVAAAAAAAVAAADAAAVAAAAADAVAVAAADAGSDRWYQRYEAAYKAALAKIQPVVDERYGELRDRQLDQAVALFDTLIKGEWPTDG